MGCHETIFHILFVCLLSASFWNEVDEKILNTFNSCRSLSLAYRDVILGFSNEEMDLANYTLILAKSYLWTCRCKETKPSLSHFTMVLLKKYQTKKYISFKSKNTTLFRKKMEDV